MTTTVFLLIFGALTYFIAGSRAPFIFPLAFGFFALLLLYISLLMWFGIANGNVLVQDGWFGGGKVRSIRICRDRVHRQQDREPARRRHQPVLRHRIEPTQRQESYARPDYPQQERSGLADRRDAPSHRPATQVATQVNDRRRRVALPLQPFNNLLQFARDFFRIAIPRKLDRRSDPHLNLFRRREPSPGLLDFK